MLIPKEMKIYCYLPATDMRKSINGLSLLIVDVLKMNPMDGHLFLFRSRHKNKLKALYYEPNCFTLIYRRLERGRFVFPKEQEGVIEMNAEHFRWLLASDKYSDLKLRDTKYHHCI